jgi:hypothetical protein
MKNLQAKLSTLTSLYAKANPSSFEAKDYLEGIQIASKELAGLRAEYLAQGCAVLPPRPLIKPIEILIVLDGTTTFAPAIDPSDLNFSLSEVVGTLQNAQQSPKFNVTKAHRNTDPYHAADIDTFTFDRHDQYALSNFDEVWLLGYDGPSNSSPQLLSPNENAAIAAFMNAGGGVFATGDHEDLGASMSGHIPRVRSMRKWFVNQIIDPNTHQSYLPPGWPEAPTGYEPRQPQKWGAGTRHDTLQKDVNGAYFFDNQSDDIPQTLQIITDSAGYPHPVLADWLNGSPFAAISHFPDHMHEGEVIVPWPGITNPTIGGTEFDEYPTKASIHPLPTIIANGTVIGGHSTPDENMEPHQGDPGRCLDGSRNLKERMAVRLARFS